MDEDVETALLGVGVGVVGSEGCSCNRSKLSIND